MLAWWVRKWETDGHWKDGPKQFVFPWKKTRSMNLIICGYRNRIFQKILGSTSTSRRREKDETAMVYLTHGCEGVIMKRSRLLTMLKERVDIWRDIFARPWVRTFVAVYGVICFLDSPVPDFIVAKFCQPNTITCGIAST